MNVFEKINSLKFDYDAIRSQIRTHRGNVSEMTSAIKDRISADRKISEERIAELKRQMQDPSKTETVRKIYAAEIEKLESASFTPTDSEIEMLDAELSAYEKAVQDFRKVDGQLRDAIRNAKEELESIRNEINKGVQPSDFSDQIKSERKGFERLCNHSQEGK